jgi:hypothetical protein
LKALGRHTGEETERQALDQALHSVRFLASEAVRLARRRQVPTVSEQAYRE